VVGQIIDYAKDLSRWSYEDLEGAVKAACTRTNTESFSGLYALACAPEGAQTDEATFIDTVGRNLRRGRFLLLIVGDGIQESAETMADFLQQHAGLHFTLALVEMDIFEMPKASGGYFIQPRILTKTTNIERGIVRVEEGRIEFHAPPAAAPSKTASEGKRTSITEDRFYEELGRNKPNVPARLKTFVERLSDLNITTEFGTKSLSLRWHPDEDRAWSLGAIITDGKVWTEFLHQQADTVGLLNLSHRYVEKLAQAVPGAYIKEAKPLSWHVDKNGTYINVDELLDYSDAWYEAIKEFTTAATAALALSE
jgi:hypothetical protein